MGVSITISIIKLCISYNNRLMRHMSQLHLLRARRDYCLLGKAFQKLGYRCIQWEHGMLICLPVLGKVNLKGLSLNLTIVLRKIPLSFYLRTESSKPKIKTVGILKLREDVRLAAYLWAIYCKWITWRVLPSLWFFNKYICNNAPFIEHCQETGSHRLIFQITEASELFSDTQHTTLHCQ